VAVAGDANAEVATNVWAAPPCNPQVVAQAKKLAVNAPLAFNFSDASSSCALIKSKQEEGSHSQFRCPRIRDGAAYSLSNPLP
jgi:hypothetical protein